MQAIRTPAQFGIGCVAYDMGSGDTMSMARSKIILLYLLVGLSVPSIFLLNAIYIPEPYSHMLRYVAKLPLYPLMPLMENKELMRELTLMVFGKMTETYIPIQVLILFTFWFLLSILLLFFIRTFFKKK